jgi:hypothetical protein
MLSEQYMAIMIAVALLFLYFAATLENTFLVASALAIAVYAGYCSFDRMQAWRTLGKPILEQQSLRLSREDLNITEDHELDEYR